MKTIMNYPTKYGFFIRNKDLYPVIPIYEVKVDSAISNFADFSFKYKINYKILKMFNPWLKENFLTNKDKKTYSIKIPKEGFLDFDQLMKDVGNKNEIFNDSINSNH